MGEIVKNPPATEQQMVYSRPKKAIRAVWESWLFQAGSLVVCVVQTCLQAFMCNG